MALTPHKSSFISGSAFNSKEQEVEIRMKNGHSYIYPCTAEEYAAFVASDSQGKFYHEMFKTRQERPA